LCNKDDDDDDDNDNDDDDDDDNNNNNNNNNPQGAFLLRRNTAYSSVLCYCEFIFMLPIPVAARSKA
jgi:hypothetical protein